MKNGEIINSFLNELQLILGSEAPELTPQQIDDIMADAGEALEKLIKNI